MRRSTRRWVRALGLAAITGSRTSLGPALVRLSGAWSLHYLGPVPPRVQTRKVARKRWVERNGLILVRCAALGGLGLLAVPLLAFSLAAFALGFGLGMVFLIPTAVEHFRWLANLRLLEIEQIKSVPYVPVSHPFVERLIGTIRREYLDRVFFWNAADLARKLIEFKDYYNAYRVHRSLDGTTPAQRAGASTPAPAALDHHAWHQHCRGLFQTPIAV